ncbi:hypothetical protein [Hymenobacter citatus]|nr:hypothetical protein [Hymenobacter citatus]
MRKRIWQMAADKKRIANYLENPQQGIPDGIKFIKPFTLPAAK